MTTDGAIQFAIPEIDDDDIDAVTRVLRSGWITTGDECAALEAELAEYLDVPHVVTTSSCTAALEIALANLELPRGSRIGVPTWTFASSALTAVREGFDVVLLDVEPDTLNLSTDALADAIDEGLDAVVAVHFAGVACDEKVFGLCADHGIPLVEDAAHALGTSTQRGLVNGRGTAGACFSFYATKNLTSGEGGALATDDAELAEFARTFRLHGMSKDAWARYHPDKPGGYDVIAPGIKGNMPDLLAALARSQFLRFEDRQIHRRHLVERYRTNLGTIPGLRFVPDEADAGSANHLMVVLLPEGTDRAQVRQLFADRMIGTSVHFQPLHQLQWFRDNVAIARYGVATADELAPRALSLPLHPAMGDHEVDRVCATLFDALA